MNCVRCLLLLNRLQVKLHSMLLREGGGGGGGIYSFAFVICVANECGPDCEESVQSFNWVVYTNTHTHSHIPTQTNTHII